MARRRRHRSGFFALILDIRKARRKRASFKKRTETKRIATNNRYQKQLLSEYAKEKKLEQQTKDAWSPVQPLKSTPGINTPGQSHQASERALKPGQCGYPTKDGHPCQNMGKCPYHANKRRPKSLSTGS